MRKNRFVEIMRVLRFDDLRDRRQRLDEDKLAPIREIFEMLNGRLTACYRPSANLTIDEQLYGTRGRCPIKQYMPNKPDKYGIKTLWLCDAENSYPLKGEVYVGKQPQETIAEAKERNKPHALVLRLLERYRRSGRNVTTDNWFTSKELAVELLANQITLVGTLRKNKSRR